MIPKQLRTLGTGAALILGGLLTLNLASSATIRALRSTNEAKRVKLKSQTLFGSITFLFPLLGVRFSLVRFWCRERWRRLVRFAEGKGLLCANCAKEMPPYIGRLCTTQLPSTPAFALLAMETGCSMIVLLFF